MKRKWNLVAFESQNGTRRSEQVDDPEIEGLWSFFDDLPDCIISSIFLRLPMKAVLVCRCVCKSWRTLISDPRFAELHLEHAQVDVLIRTSHRYQCVSRALHLLDFEPEMFQRDSLVFCSCEISPKTNYKSCLKLDAKFKLPLRDAKSVLGKRIEAGIGGSKRHDIAWKSVDDKFGVVNSCNGLLCLCDPRDKIPLVVCNPVTGEFIRLPKHITFATGRGPIICGFGFDPTTNEYKVIRVNEQYTPLLHHSGIWKCDGIIAELHTLGTSIWKTVERPPATFIKARFPTFVNGSLHWLSCTNEMIGMILSFNFESESFQKFPSPSVVNEYGLQTANNISMGVLKGCIYICDACFAYIKLWMMKEYGVGESWTKVFNVNLLYGCTAWPSRGLYLPLKLYNNGAILMYHSFNCLIYWEPGKSGFRYFSVLGTRYEFKAMAHIPSLVSLKDAVKGDNVEVLNVHSWCAALKLPEEEEVLLLAEENVNKASLFFSNEDPDQDLHSEDYFF